jgi:hypothetical protein
MTFIEFLVFLIGVCVGYGIGFWSRLGLWSPVIALISGIVFVVAFIFIRIMLGARR